MPSLHNAMLFKTCRNYIGNGSRVTRRSDSLPIPSLGDNNYDTWTRVTDLHFDLSEGSDATRVDAVFLKTQGVTSYRADTTTGNNRYWNWRTFPSTVKNYADKAVSTTVNGFQHDMLLLNTAITTRSVRLRFRGTSDIQIHAVMFLEFVLEFDVNATDTVSIETKYVDRTGVVYRFVDNSIQRGVPITNARHKWELDYELKIIDGTTTHESVDDFVSLLYENQDCVFAQEFSRYPARVFPATLQSDSIEISQRSDWKGAGDTVSFQIVEQ